MPDFDVLRETNRKLIQAFDKVLKNDTWQKTRYLRALHQNVMAKRDEFAKRLGMASIVQPKAPETERASTAKNVEYVKLYISLYNAKGEDLRSWEKALHNRGASMLSRPVYQQESDVKAMIRSKAKPMNEAYISVDIDKNYIINPIGGRTPTDALGHELIVLKDKAIPLGTIHSFHHKTGDYKLEGEKLVPLSPSQQSE